MLGSMTAADMRSLRRRLGLTQAQMAAYLRLAPANGKD